MVSVTRITWRSANRIRICGWSGARRGKSLSCHRLPAAQRKMADWLANGVELGWLIDGDARCVYVFRQGSEVRVLAGIDRIAGEGPLTGFVLELGEIWEGL